MNNSIFKFDGKCFNIKNIDLFAIDIEDIAHALAQEARAMGRLREFFSVAQHSVICSLMVPPELAKAALLHDGGEAYARDLATPVKDMLGAYKLLEGKYQQHVYSRFGIKLSKEDRLIIKRADAACWEMEKRLFVPGQMRRAENAQGRACTRAHEMELIDDFIAKNPSWYPLDWRDAKASFMRRFAEVA